MAERLVNVRRSVSPVLHVLKRRLARRELLGNPTMSSNWYIDDVQGKVLGPLTTEEVIDGIRSDRIPLLSMGRSSHENESRPLVHFAEFQSFLVEELSRRKQG